MQCHLPTRSFILFPDHPEECEQCTVSGTMVQYMVPPSSQCPATVQTAAAWRVTLNLLLRQYNRDGGTGEQFY